MVSQRCPQQPETGGISGEDRERSQCWRDRGVMVGVVHFGRGNSNLIDS